MIRRPPRSTLDRSSAASDVYKRQTLISPSELQLTHTSGIIPIGINIPIDFSIPPGISPFLSVLWDYTCPTEEGCVVDLPLEGCPVIADGCIEGFVYMECGELPFINQEVLSDWTIELLDDTGLSLIHISEPTRPY